MLVFPDLWRERLWDEISRRLDASPPGDHPNTFRLAVPGEALAYYIKLYAAPTGAGWIKGFFRDSKALRALKQSEALSRLGFYVPPPVAAGQERSALALGRAFLVTREIIAQPLPVALRERFTAPNPRGREKRRWVEKLAGEIRRLHLYGFVHGDLIASNIMVGCGQDGGPIFYLMDHDRTRRYPAWIPQRLWRRNLVQLNRFALPGISLRDRVRFMRVYSEDSDRRLNAWVEGETHRRYGAKRKLLQAGREIG